jgi:general stress protein CsbA
MNINPFTPFIFLAMALIFLVASYLSPHGESVMDIFFLAVSIVLGTISINLFRKRRLEKKLSLY